VGTVKRADEPRRVSISTGERRSQEPRSIGRLGLVQPAGLQRQVEGGGDILGLHPHSGSSYIAGDLAKWLHARNIKHLRGAPYHPMTQGKIERWHQTLKNRILLENYFLPGDLEAQIAAFVDDYNNRRYHESIGNPTPADAYSGRGHIILQNAKGSNDKPSPIAACSTASRLPNITTAMSQSLS
jgi:putative transposase